MSDFLKPKWTIGLLQSMHWRKFEEFCAAYFQAKGLITQVSPADHDGGIDVYLYKRGIEGLYSVVQCKYYSDNTCVSSLSIREFLGAMVSIGVNQGYFITTGRFTEDSKDYVKCLLREKNYKIYLIDGKLLRIFLISLPMSSQLPLFSFLVTNIKLEQKAPTCQFCGSPMIKRSSNKNNGFFWGCSSYHETGCKFTISI